MRIRPPSEKGVIRSWRTVTPIRTAMAGLMYVTTAARPGPASLIRMKYAASATAVQATPSPRSASSTPGEGTRPGSEKSSAGVRTAAGEHRTNRIEDGDDHDAADTNEFARTTPYVKPHQRGYAREADQEARHAHRPQPLGAEVDDGDRERDAGDDDRRQRRGDEALADRNECEGQRQVADSEHRNPASARPGLGEAASGSGQRQQQRRAEQEP